MGLAGSWGDGDELAREELSPEHWVEARRLGKVLGKGRAVGGDLLSPGASRHIQRILVKELLPRLQLITQQNVCVTWEPACEGTEPHKSPWWSWEENSRG